MNGKSIVFWPVVFACAAAFAAEAEDLVLESGRVEVVVAPRAPSATRYAATELTNFLSRVFGAPVPVRTKPTPPNPRTLQSSNPPIRSIILGTNGWSVAEGLDPVALGKPDSFLIRATPERLYLCGVDGGCGQFERIMAMGRSYGELTGTWSTLFAVYEFLEKYADCRFYWPGELGEIVPRADRVRVPLGTTKHVPDLLIRKYYHPISEYYHSRDGWIAGNELSYNKGLALNWLRTRMSSFDIPCCHGTVKYRILERYGKEHPEYFALKADGKTRYMTYEGTESSRAGHFCYSSKVSDALFEDIRAYFLKEPPESRKICRDWANRWCWPTCFRGPYADIMPNDAMRPCQCERCKATYRKGDPNDMTELIWGFTRDMAQRLIDEKIPGNVTQMAYAPYSRVPDFDLPTNVMVMVAKTGPFAIRKKEQTARDNAEIRKWKAKTGGVWIWTYPDKYGERNIPGVPPMTPRAWGEYYRGIAPDVFGIFAESECDRFFFQHLNYYLFSRLCWDTKADWRALLDEYYVRMYGAAAPEAKRFCEELEDVFLDRFVGSIVFTSLGPKAKAPTLHEVWTDLYSSAKLDRWAADLARGAAKLKPGSPEARRFAVFRDELWGTMRRTCDAYLDRTDARRNAAKLRANPPKYDLLLTNGWSHVKVRDRDVRIVSDASFRIVSTNRSEGVEYYLDGRAGAALKRNARYRISFFVKGKDIVPTRRGGGAVVVIRDSFAHYFPETAHLVGTFDWIHQTYEFKTASDTNDRIQSYMDVCLSGATGTMWVDGVRLEEIPDQVVRADACAVVVDPASPRPVLLAAKALSLNLARRFGVAKVPVRRSPEGVAFAFVVGTNRWSAAAGVRTDGLKDGEYRVKSVPGAVYIVGVGDAAEYGVYGFLQREADCRFFFPGELGEIVRPGADLPLQKLDYTADLGPLACYIASCRAEDGFARHLDFCVRRTEKLPPSVNPGVFYGAYMNRMFGRGNTSWYMGQFFAGKSPEKMFKHAGDDAPKDDPLVRRRVELFRGYEAARPR